MVLGGCSRRNHFLSPGECFWDVVAGEVISPGECCLDVAAGEVIFSLPVSGF